jgi:hypothetical protein
MGHPISSSCARSKRRWIVAVFLTFTAMLTGLVLWFSGILPVSRDPLFRGKPESEWIANLEYGDDQQVEEWRAYGEEGVQVLIRGLERANRPGERAYRRFNELLPDFPRQWLPAPRRDSTQETRECLVSLLSSLGSDAKSAAPVMIRTASTDEFHGVRQSAIGFFITSAGDNTLLNQIPVKEKKALLPALIRAVQDPGNWGLRNNAAILLKFYPEQREVVGPVLVKALQAYSDSIVPALAIAGQRKDSVGGYARVAHKKWQSRSDREPDGSANGSQPFRSETNSTASAAGSRR